MGTLEVGLIGIGITVLVHFAGTIFWAGNMNARVRNLEKEIDHVSKLPERMAGLEAVVQTLVSTAQSLDKNVNTVKDFLIAQGHNENRHLKQLIEKD